jgi:hypothetical protein
MSYIKMIMNEAAGAALETLLWSETGEHGDPLDDEFSVSDIDDAGADEVADDVYAFIDMIIDSDNAEAWEHVKRNPAQIGQDFILTRNGHGAGFWDRGLGDLGDLLTEWAKPFGTVGLYVGDDERLYVHN